jgi:hypothetical protein
VVEKVRVGLDHVDLKVRRIVILASVAR